MVHVHAGQLLADGLDEQRGHDGRVHTAGQGQKDLLIADLLPQGGNLLVDKSLGQFGRGDARHALGAFVVCHRLIPPYFFIITMAIKYCHSNVAMFCGCRVSGEQNGI